MFPAFTRVRRGRLAAASCFFESDTFLAIASLTGLLAASMLAGCVTMKRPPGSATAATPTAKSEPVEVAGAQPDLPPPDALAAIEDFLTRTQQYRVAPAPVPATPGANAPKEKTARPSATGAGPEVAARSVPDLPQANVTVNAQMAIGEPAQTTPKLALPAVTRVAIQTQSSGGQERDAPPCNAINQPMVANDSHRAGSVEEMIVQLKADVEAHNDFESQWRLRLALLAFGDEDEARQATPTLADPEREILLALIGAASAVRDLAQNPMSNSGSQWLELENLEAAFTARADPRITELALCRKVLTYGAYEEMPAEEFVAGRSTQTIVYSELRNYQSQRANEGFETRLATRIEILSQTGQSMWIREEPEIVDLCRKRRRDFFLAQRIAIPATLPADSYVLKVYVEDQVAGKGTEASIPLTILSPVSIAKSTGP